MNTRPGQRRCASAMFQKQVKQAKSEAAQHLGGVLNLNLCAFRTSAAAEHLRYTLSTHQSWDCDFFIISTHTVCAGRDGHLSHPLMRRTDPLTGAVPAVPWHATAGVWRVELRVPIADADTRHAPTAAGAHRLSLAPSRTAMTVRSRKAGADGRKHRPQSDRDEPSARGGGIHSFILGASRGGRHGGTARTAAHDSVRPEP